MCGIGGVWGVDDAELLARRISAAVARRGPDAHGTWVAEDRSDALVHRRLAILDLDPRSNQPLIDRRSGKILVFNGEIFNYRQLRKQLESEREFSTEGDSEVLLAALVDRGLERGLASLVGQFAFALFDPKSRELILVRDRIGIKPLFWRRLGSGLAFASEAGPLLELPDTSNRFDPEVLGQWLQLGYAPGRRCLVDGLEKIPAGHLLRCVPGSEPRLERWYDPLEAANQGSEGSFAEVLAQATSDRLIADVPLGLFLSGGVDSTLVASLAGPGHRAVTIARDDDQDESSVAAASAARLGLKHRIETLEASDVAEFAERWLEVAADPIADPSLAPTWLVSKLARESMTVALSGDGGDELFSGYPRLRAMPRLESVLALPKWSRPSGLTRLLPGTRGRSKLEAALHCSEPFAAYQSLQGIWPKANVESMLGRELALPWSTQTIDRVRELPSWTRWRALDLLSFLPERVLSKVDRAAMDHALEVRVPILDHRVVERALGLPEDQVRGKGLLRSLLPEGIELPKKKRGFEIPLSSWLGGELGGWLDGLPERCAELGLQPRPIAQAIIEQARNRYDRAEGLFALHLLTRYAARWL